MKRLRVTFVVENLEAWDAQQAAAAAALGLPREEFVAEVWARDGGPLDERLRSAGVAVRIVGRRPRRAWCAAEALATQASAAADVVHLADDWSLRNVGLWYARGRAAPYVCTLRDFRRDVPWLRLRTEFEIVRRAAAVVVADPFLARRRSEEYGLSEVPARWQSIVDPRLPLAGPPPAREALLAELGLPAKSRLLGTCGPLSAAQNTPDVVWIGMLLKILHDDLRIVLVGDGPRHEALQRFVTLGEVADRTRIVSSPAEFERIAPHLSLYLDAAKWSGPSSALLTAQGCGLPVVAVDTPFTRSRIVHERTGYLVGEHDRAAMTRHCHRLLENDALHRTMGDAARRSVPDAAANAATIAAYAELYRRIATTNDRHREIRRTPDAAR